MNSITAEERQRVIDDKAWWSQQTQRLLDSMYKSGFKVRISSKREGYRKRWHRAAIKILMFLMSRERRKNFREHYITTFGSDIYWNTAQDFDPGNMLHFAILYHECVHMVQDRKWFRIFYFLFYLLLPFPIFLTGRGLIFERQAYRETARVYLSGGQTFILDREIDKWEKEFTSPAYLWMDPFFKGGFGNKGKIRKAIESRNLPLSKGYLEKIGFSLEYHPIIKEKVK